MRHISKHLHPSYWRGLGGLLLGGAFLLSLLLFIGCNKDQGETERNTSLTVDGRINKFIVEGVNTYYLWEAETDWEQYEKNEAYAAFEDHYSLFDLLIYRDDKWSALTEDIDDLENQFAGVSTTFGYALAFYYHPFKNNDEVVAIILYTSSDSPAAQAGLKRGDVILAMDGDKITAANYMRLYYARTIQLQCGAPDFEDRTITPLPELYNLTAVEMYENPINSDTIIIIDDHKIGYLCYTGYQMQSEGELLQLFSQFKSAGVTDFVLDLRYNPGGYSRTAQLLSSILAPASALSNKSVYLEHHYNKLYTEFLEKNGYELNERFIDTITVNGKKTDMLSFNIDLDRLYVLTGNRSASASEATMVGLEPYLSLIQIGDTTSGKYCGGVLLKPEDIYEAKNKPYYTDFANWGMYIMIYRFANIKGIESFSGGLVPTILAMENAFDLKPFGHADDPLLGRALAHIMGVSYVESRSSKVALPLTALPVPRRPSDGLLIAPLPVLPPR